MFSSHPSHQNLFKKNKLNILLWGLFSFMVFFSYHFLSDGDFSFLLVCDQSEGRKANNDQ